MLVRSQITGGMRHVTIVLRATSSSSSRSNCISYRLIFHFENRMKEDVGEINVLILLSSVALNNNAA